MPEREKFETTSRIETTTTPADGRASPIGETGFQAVPFTGVQPTMYRGRFWTMRQYAGFGAAESNRRYHYLLSSGKPCRSPSTYRHRWASTRLHRGRAARNRTVGVAMLLALTCCGRETGSAVGPR
jgi:hypothetical protein